MKKLNIISIVGLILIFGFLIIRSHKNSDLKATVEITDQGFSLETIIVEKGTTITWVNVGERLRWPASNFHPTHTYYPTEGGCLGSTLDACKGLQKGESFSFKMEELGSWPMHDHLAPGLTMIVEVVPDKVKAENSTKENSEKMTPEELRNSDYGIQLSYIKQITDDDPVYAWGFLKEAFFVNGSVVGNAHELSHIIGNKLYEREGLAGIKACDTTFAYGCMHGVTEEMLMQEGVGKVKSIEEKCLQFFPPDQNLFYTGCIHGMGHGLYTFGGGNLKEALNNCDIISIPYRNYCYDGVFMENSSTPSNITFDKNDPWKLCAPLPEQYHQPCAKYQSQIFLTQTSSTPEIGKYCALGPTELLKETCFQSFGYYQAQKYFGDVDKIINECNKITDSYGREVCATGGAIETIFQKYGNWAESAKKICNTLHDRKALCFEKINVMMIRDVL